MNLGGYATPAMGVVAGYPANDGSSELKLSPCEYNFSDFHKCLKNEVLLYRGRGEACAGLCNGFANEIIENCKKKLKGKGCTGRHGLGLGDPPVVFSNPASTYR